MTVESGSRRQALTDAEWAKSLKDSSKRIPGDINWIGDEHRSHVRRFQAGVDIAAGYLLSVRGYYNPRAMMLSYTMFLGEGSRIYGLDLGKSHRNPGGDRVGKKHKHRWSERYQDNEAYVPADITEPASDPVAVWRQFCAEAGLRHDGALEQPVLQEGRFS